MPSASAVHLRSGFRLGPLEFCCLRILLCGVKLICLGSVMIARSPEESLAKLKKQKWRREHYLQHKEEIQQYKRAYYKANQQKIAQVNASYYQNNKDKFTQYKRDEVASHKAQIRELLRIHTQEARVRHIFGLITNLKGSSRERVRHFKVERLAPNNTEEIAATEMEGYECWEIYTSNGDLAGTDRFGRSDFGRPYTQRGNG